MSGSRALRVAVAGSADLAGRFREEDRFSDRQVANDGEEEDTGRDGEHKEATQRYPVAPGHLTQAEREVPLGLSQADRRVGEAVETRRRHSA